MFNDFRKNRHGIIPLNLQKFSNESWSISKKHIKVLKNIKTMKTMENNFFDKIMMLPS